MTQKANNYFGESKEKIWVQLTFSGTLEKINDYGSSLFKKSELS